MKEIKTVAALQHNHHHHANQSKHFWKDISVWKRSALNTLTCLTGCIIGDFSMIVYLQVYRPETPLWMQMLLATAAGLVSSIAFEALLLKLREKMNWIKALQLALSMSVISIIGMELVMNLTDFMITGGKAQITSVGYWLAFIPSAIAGFLAPLPYNYYQLKKFNRSHH